MKFFKGGFTGSFPHACDSFAALSLRKKGGPRRRRGTRVPTSDSSSHPYLCLSIYPSNLAHRDLASSIAIFKSPIKYDSDRCWGDIQTNPFRSADKNQLGCGDVEEAPPAPTNVATPTLTANERDEGAARRGFPSAHDSA